MTLETNPVIPYQETAEAVILNDESVLDFIVSVFPNARPEDLEKLTHFVVGLFHDGIEYGLALGTDDADSSAEAYLQGVEDGKKAREDETYTAFIAGMFETFKILTGEEQ